jgi:predicted MFS family arabinose efflux permease
MLLRKRDFRLLWSGQTTSTLGNAASTAVFPLIAITELDAGTFAVALIEAVIWLPWLLIGLPAGVLVDRLRNRAVMLWCDAVGVLTLGLVALAIALDVLTTAHLVLAAAVGGVRAVFFEPAYYKYLPALVDDHELPTANSLLQGGESAAGVMGPSIGGVVVSAFGALTAVVADALSFLVSALCLLGIRTTEPSSAPRAGSHFGRQLVEGVRFTVRDGFLRAFAATGGLLNFALAGAGALQILFLVRENEAPVALAGALIGAAGLGGLIGAAMSGWIARALGTARAAVCVTTAAALFGLLVPLTGRGWGLTWFVVGTIGQTAAVVAVNVIMASFTQRYCPRAVLARVMMTSRVLAYAAAPVGALVAGGLGTLVGVRATLWVLALSALSAVAVQVLSPIAGQRDLPTGYPPPAAKESPSGVRR